MISEFFYSKGVGTNLRLARHVAYGTTRMSRQVILLFRRELISRDRVTAACQTHCGNVPRRRIFTFLNLASCPLMTPSGQFSLT